MVIIGDGPGGYEGALVARQLGADVTLVSAGRIGGSAVLTDCVPSKTLIATSEAIDQAAASGYLGVRIDGRPADRSAFSVDLATVNERILELAHAQSAGIRQHLEQAGVEIVHGRGTLTSEATIEVTNDDASWEITADTILLATGARPRVLADAAPDGERILSWEQIYRLDELPEHLIVVGSGVTRAEFASAFHALGSTLTLVSSSDRVLPGEDVDVPSVLEDVFTRRGLNVCSRSRAVAARRVDNSVIVTSDD